MVIRNNARLLATPLCLQMAEQNRRQCVFCEQSLSISAYFIDMQMTIQDQYAQEKLSYNCREIAWREIYRTLLLTLMSTLKASWIQVLIFLLRMKKDCY